MQELVFAKSGKHLPKSQSTYCVDVAVSFYSKGTIGPLVPRNLKTVTESSFSNEVAMLMAPSLPSKHQTNGLCTGE
jgi:hypothetical protein